MRLLIPLAHITGLDGEAGLTGKIQIARIEYRVLADQTPEHRRLQVVDHDFFASPALRVGNLR
jgi:hypothetical protein